MHLDFHALQVRHPAARADAPDALRGVDLQVGQAEQVAVIGPSGAGKTSLLHALALALRPTAGALQLDGTNPWLATTGERQALRRRLFLAPQVPPLPPRQRVITSVLAARLPAMGLLASLRSLIYPSDIPAAHAALQRFDLANKLFDRVDRLSGGERQRVGLTRALLAPASLWLIDEPLSALDPVRAEQATATLVQAAREQNVTLVATLHQVDMALAHFPRIVGLRDGRKVFDLAAGQVSAQHLADLYAQQDGRPGRQPSDQPVDEPAVLLPATLQCR